MIKYLIEKIFKKEQKPSSIKDLIKDPDNYIYTIEVIDGDIIITAKKKDSE